MKLRYAWKNTSQYSQIEVSLDGVVIVTLPGSAQAASVPLPGSGSYEICLDGTTICDEPFPQVCCTVVCPFPPQPVTDLQCEVVDPCECVVELTWTNQDPDYDTIEVFLNIFCDSRFFDLLPEKLGYIRHVVLLIMLEISILVFNIHNKRQKFRTLFSCCCDNVHTRRKYLRQIEDVAPALLGAHIDLVESIDGKDDFFLPLTLLRSLLEELAQVRIA